MLNLSAKSKTMITAKMVTILIAIVVAITLPQIFHVLGIASGLGSSLGAAFLPMHLPVLLAGLIAGPFAGLLSGAVSPILSFALSGMPAALMLPFMTIELAVYGLVCGLLHKTRMPIIVKLLLAQMIGRLVRGASILLAIFFFNSKLASSAVYNTVLIGLPGIVLQWVIIPLVYYRIKGLKRFFG